VSRRDVTSQVEFGFKSCISYVNVIMLHGGVGHGPPKIFVG